MKRVRSPKWAGQRMVVNDALVQFDAKGVCIGVVRYGGGPLLSTPEPLRDEDIGVLGQLQGVAVDELLPPEPDLSGIHPTGGAVASTEPVVQVIVHPGSVAEPEPAVVQEPPADDADDHDDHDDPEPVAEGKPAKRRPGRPKKTPQAED